MYTVCYAYMHANIGHERPHYDRVVAAAYFKRTQNSSFFFHFIKIDYVIKQN